MAGVDDTERSAWRIGEVTPRAAAAVSHSGFEQGADRVVMGGAAIALPRDGPVPVEAVDLEGGKNLVAGSLLFARRIDVLDAQQPLAVMTACFEITRNRGEQ